jgi:phenylacetate-coenzyme A ligase PaaK-like adenylate-forming protein
MFETGVRQFRMAMAMVWGRPISPRVLRRLITDSLATLAEFGAPGDDVAQLVDGPFADPELRRDFSDRALRRTARRLARLSPFYAQRFAESGVRPESLTVDSLSAVPLTRKADLVARGRDFLCDGSVPVMSTRTTGSTGAPAEIWMSRYESELWPAFAALSGLLRDEIRPTDHMQVCISSRATAAVQQNITLCRLVGAQVRVVGVVPPDEALDALTGSTGPTMLATYPSYLAQLVTGAQRRGLSPDDFRLRRVDVGGEPLSSALAAAARTVFGVPLVNDTFAMTEVLPVSGRTCGSGHLHHDLNTGLVEVLTLDGTQPAAPGELGTVVITPYYPYRECMPVLRYDTRDVVRRLPDEPLECDLAAIPATSALLGKADHLLYAPGAAEPVTGRSVVEALESLPTRPWPARFRLGLDDDGAVTLTVPEQTVAGCDLADVREHLAERGLDVRLHVVRVDDPRELRRVRADLLETTFADPLPTASLLPVGG